MNAVMGMRSAASALMLVLLCACAAGDKPTPVPVQPVVKAAGNRAVVVTLEQSGAKVELGLGQELVVRLAVEGTDGREWSLVDLAPGVLNATGPKFERDLLGTTTNDASGQAIWHLKPSAAGTVALRFEYRRPRNVAPAVQVATFTVTVR